MHEITPTESKTFEVHESKARIRRIIGHIEDNAFSIAIETQDKIKDIQRIGPVILLYPDLDKYYTTVLMPFDESEIEKYSVASHICHHGKRVFIVGCKVPEFQIQEEYEIRKIDAEGNTI